MVSGSLINQMLLALLFKHGQSFDDWSFLKKFFAIFVHIWKHLDVDGSLYCVAVVVVKFGKIVQ